AGSSRCSILAFALPFFPGDGVHRDLHSFPTRRSSDPAAEACTSARSCPFGTSLSLAPVASPFSTAPVEPGSAAPSSGTCSSAARSEEHTSELQSRENLVCRLLLEKKKSAHRDLTPQHY